MISTASKLPISPPSIRMGKTTKKELKSLKQKGKKANTFSIQTESLDKKTSNENKGPVNPQASPKKKNAKKDKKIKKAKVNNGNDEGKSKTKEAKSDKTSSSTTSGKPRVQANTKKEKKKNSDKTLFGLKDFNINVETKKQINSNDSSSKSENDSTHNAKRMKRVQWKQKQMAKKLKRMGKQSDISEGSAKVKGKKQKEVSIVKTKPKDQTVPGKTDGKPSPKVHVAKTAEEATSNWKKLQTSNPKQTGSTTHVKPGMKRKIPEHKIRNPKYRKVEEQTKSEDQNATKESEPEIWFDDVDEILLDRKMSKSTITDAGKEAEAVEPAEMEAKDASTLVKQGAFKGLTKVVGMDCEMVGVGDGTDSVLARVSIVNQFGEPVYDKFVKPKEDVVDYRTHVSGVRPKDLEDAELFEDVQKEVASILKGRLLVGHAIQNDLQVLFLSHPKRKIRDTSRYKRFRQLMGGRTPSLKNLSEKVLAVKVQEGEHNSIQDAQATMRLYTMHRQQWEAQIKEKTKSRGKKTDGKKKPKPSDPYNLNVKTRLKEISTSS